MAGRVLIQIRELKQYFPIKGKGEIKYIKANDDISLDIYEGETLGIVGESGCGKSTLGRTILQLYPGQGGSTVYFKEGTEGIHLEKLTEKQMAPLRKDLQLIFQDPYSSLNPRMTVGQIIGEGLLAHGMYDRDYIYRVMERCGLAPYFIHRYPHQFSGGQRQRIGIARALALKPKFIVCDEAVSALDVSIQSQILNLLLDLKEKHSLTYLFISHDLSVVKYISDRIGVMYLGNIVELSEAEELFSNPVHPYTEALLSAIPTTDSKKHTAIILEGDIPSQVNPPSGCKFHTRCRYRTDICRTEVPQLLDIGGGHLAACHNKYRKSEILKERGLYVK